MTLQQTGVFVVIVVIAFACFPPSSSGEHAALATLQHWPGVPWFPLLWPALRGVNPQSTINNQQSTGKDGNINGLS